MIGSDGRVDHWKDAHACDFVGPGITDHVLGFRVEELMKQSWDIWERNYSHVLFRTPRPFIYQLFIHLFRLIVIKCGLDFQLTSRGRMINYRTNAIG